MLTTKAPGTGRRVDPAAAGGLDLETPEIVLQQQGQPAVVLVGADALARRDLLAGRIPDDLDVRVRLVVEPGVEVRLRLAECGREGAEHLAGDPVGLVQPSQDRRL